ncbi:siderophore ABC transporter substrate-binding protein [Actinomyces bowdenii]|uniref:Iron ABC transporter substrate-binding protein n=1 Tax=Actinomyces bowdenii TaxID=131109 RepID=A0A3P1VA19_9ACTO|nr:ABC transporter substrate-binding protein [Actinomyces bowdenii]RRD30350.1 iron ABC transporter substrate-binding protein [Actinomyces bowdenii]
MTTRRSFLHLASAGVLASLAACSSSGGSAGASGGPSASTGTSASGAASAPGSSSPTASAGSAAVTPDASAFPVTVTDGKGEVTIEALPEKVVVLDPAALDTIVALGVTDRVVGVVANDGKLPSTLSGSYSGAEVVGTLHEPSAEKIDALGPDLVIVGGRAAKHYDTLSQDFTTVLMPSSGTTYGERLTEGAELLGKVLGVPAKATQELEAFRTRADEVKAKASTAGKGLILLTTGGEVTAYGPGSRFGLIHDDLGVVPAIADLKPETHGESVSFERIAEANPDWLFVVDRDAAIGESGKAAKEVLDTELVTSTTAWSKDQVVYLDGERWYIIGAGLHNAPTLVEDIATAIKA